MTITKEGALASFYTVNKAPIKHLKVYFSPKQAGEGNPSPENIREIAGHNEIELNYTNEVLFEIPPGKYTWIVPECYKGKTILYSGYVDNTNGTKDAKLSFRFYDKENATISTGTSLDYVPIGEKKVINVLFTLTDDINSVVFNMSVSSTAIVGTRQVILSSNIISNKIYYNQNKTIDWSNTIGTIYGGYIDLITGELVQTHAKYIENGTINTNTWYSLRMSSSLIYVSKSLAYLENLQPKLGHQAGIFNYLTSPLSGNSWRGAIGTKANANNNTPANNDLRIIIASADFPNISDFISYLNEHPLEFVYELETPITHQLTSVQLQTLIGQNNIWSNADRVEVEYDLAESNDELYRRRNIILRGYPHIETASGSIASFQTDLAAPIKDAKIYFNPIQIGSGDPSPSNIRELYGFDSISFKWGKEIISMNPVNFQSSTTNGLTISYLGDSTYYFDGIATANTNFAISIPSFTMNANQVYHLGLSIEAGIFNSGKKIGFGFKYDGKAYFSTILTFGTIPYLCGESSPSLNNTQEINEINFLIQSGLGNVKIKFYLSEYLFNGISPSWSSTQGTLYGGYVDLINGQLVQTHKKYKLSDFTWTKSSRGKIYISNTSNIDLLKTNRIISDSYKSVGGITVLTSLTDLTIGNYVYQNNGILYGRPAIRDDRFSTIASFIENTGNIEILTELFNPIIYTLTPQTLKTLKGVNNIWSNANGPISIQYWTH